MKLLNTIIVLITIWNTSALNILGIFPYQGRSHFIVFKTLLEELARRGHNVTVISYFPRENPPQNYHDISLAGSIPIMQDFLPIQQIGIMTHLFMSYYLTSTGRENCDLMLANNQVINLVKEKQKFDVVLAEQFNSDCALGVAFKLEVPVVGVTSHALMPWTFDRLGVPSNPAFIPFHFMAGGTRPSLLQKMGRVIADKFFRLSYYFLCQRYNQASLEERFGTMPSLEDLGREIKFLLIYQHYPIPGTALLPSNVIPVGGYHISKAKPLTGDLKKFVDDADAGVIFISFGSLVQVSAMRVEQLEAVLEAIAAFPHRFIWRWDVSAIDKPPFTDLPKHLQAILSNKNKLYRSTWLPQVDILGHPKTVAFFSHGGYGSTSEALSYGIPMIVMPIIGDQPTNAAAVVESGFGVKLEVEDLTREHIIAALNQIIDPKFQSQTKRLSKVWHDRPLPPMDTAIYWIEFAARNADLIFRLASADLALYQYLNLDVIGVFLAIFAILISIVTISITACRCCKKIRPIKSHTQSTKKKQKKN